jgi:hypothetical protein
LTEGGLLSCGPQLPKLVVLSMSGIDAATRKLFSPLKFNQTPLYEIAY